VRDNRRWLAAVVALVAVVALWSASELASPRRLEFSRRYFGCPADDAHIFTFTVVETAAGGGSYLATMENFGRATLEERGLLERRTISSLFAELAAAGAWEIEDCRGGLFRMGLAAGNVCYDLRMRDGSRRQDARFNGPMPRTPGTGPFLHAVFSGPIGRTYLALMREKFWWNSFALTGRSLSGLNDRECGILAHCRPMWHARPSGRAGIFRVGLRSAPAKKCERVDAYGEGAGAGDFAEDGDGAGTAGWGDGDAVGSLWHFMQSSAAKDFLPLWQAPHCFPALMASIVIFTPPLRVGKSFPWQSAHFRPFPR